MRDIKASELNWILGGQLGSNTAETSGESLSAGTGLETDTKKNTSLVGNLKNMAYEHSDVIAGFLTGLSFLALCCYTYRIISAHADPYPD